MIESKTCKETLVVRTSRVFPNDLNNHHTLFGGKLMSMIDDVASISAARHARSMAVTASTDSVDFLAPIKQDDSVCLQSFVTWAGKTSMEVFVKVIAENLMTGERTVAATAFLTFVTMPHNGEKVIVPAIVPESEEEIYLHETADARAQARQVRRVRSQELASKISAYKPWENEIR